MPLIPIGELKLMANGDFNVIVSVKDFVGTKFSLNELWHLHLVIHDENA